MDSDMADIQVNIFEEKELVTDDVDKLPNYNGGETKMIEDDSGGSSSKENRSTPVNVVDVPSPSYPEHPCSPENKLDQPDEPDDDADGENETEGVRRKRRGRRGRIKGGSYPEHPCSPENKLDQPDEPDDDVDGENETEGVRRKRRGRRGRIKGGRHHNRKWKPYDKLSWSERRALAERETIRATWKREEAFKSGHPVAPYNTTQFLINDHSSISPNLQVGSVVSGASVEGAGGGGAGGGGVGGGGSMGVMCYRECSGSGADSDSEFYESPNDEETFLTKDFSETYDHINAERLEKMTKEELIRDYVELESKVERIETQLRERENATVSKNENTQQVKDPRLPSSRTVSSDRNLPGKPDEEHGSEKKSPVCNCSELHQNVANLRLEISKLQQENDRLLLENLRLRDSQSQSQTSSAHS